MAVVVGKTVGGLDGIVDTFLNGVDEVGDLLGRVGDHGLGEDH